MTITQIALQILIIIGFLLLFYWYAYVYEKRKQKNKIKNNNTMTIKYDVPFEVTEKQFNALKLEHRGTLVHRIDDEGRFWIKVWMMDEVGDIKKTLKENE